MLEGAILCSFFIEDDDDREVFCHLTRKSNKTRAASRNLQLQLVLLLLALHHLLHNIANMCIICKHIKRARYMESG